MDVQLVFGNSPAFCKIVEQAELYAQTEWPVLLLGPTGSGKELVARRIHQKSLRRHGAVYADQLRGHSFGPL